MKTKMEKWKCKNKKEIGKDKKNLRKQQQKHQTTRTRHEGKLKVQMRTSALIMEQSMRWLVSRDMKG